ncbi:cytochrome c oxidase assembly protein COX11, mitochondrial isoform X1 [Dioscorea cayenensis subsp. rotundata]|uniref:Cytochrome c oxidase assembly protein COX11, mitochondrial isoform X1 n=1 Tax=Dioscorea cayennensis subsp. rotundata TaxID=55577 RepID=A0AB40D535_DIOCR|nr:cytochrome c oxidase assembly protein COX11, mitochondrial isoform X1 [Dioscorea cayenensis subsp. rotundata]
MPPFPKCPSAAVLRRVVSSATASSSSRFQIPLHRLHPELPAFPTSGSRRFYISSTAARERSSRRTLLYLVGLAGAMVGASYAAVPLYRRFCQATGYGGTVQRRESVEEKISRHDQDGTTTSRELVVQFNADVADGVPWKFIPAQREVRVKPGESALAFYTAENRSSTPITGMSTYNVTPMKAAVYFNKIQCFCFEEQRLLPGEQIDMPVFFYIDPEFETDPKMDGINNFILSYTFFKVKED